MKVTFTRTGERRYRVAVEWEGVEPLYMEPATGYDDRLPHDAEKGDYFISLNTPRAIAHAGEMGGWG